MLIAIIGAGLGVLYVIIRKPIYAAQSSFVLEEDSKSGLGQYAGLAAMAGIDVGNMGESSGLFQGDNIIELYKSRSMIEKTLLTEVDFGGKNQLLIDRYLDNSNIRDKWKNAKPEDFDFARYPRSMGQDSIISEIVEQINKDNLAVSKPDKKLSIIYVRFESKDQQLAKAFTDNIVENVNSFYTITKTKKSAQNVQILQRQADSVRRILNMAINGVAYSMDANPNANAGLKILMAPSQKRQVDVQASAAVYQEIVKNLELSKVSLRKETPLIQIIDKPVLPLKNIAIGKVGGAIAGAFLAILFLVTWLSIKRIAGL